MNISRIAIPACSLAMMLATTTWAQENGSGSSTSAASHSDPIVRMHQQVAAANRVYEHEVAAAKKVYDHKKAEATKKRDAAIKAAHDIAGQ